MDITALVETKKNPKIPNIVPGDTVKVSARIVEAGKERTQIFQGVVIKIKRGGNGASFTVRHVAYGIGVERTFPYSSPLVEKVEIVRQGKVRRSRLYYLRSLSSKEARRKIKRVERKAKQVDEEFLAELPEEAQETEEMLEEEPEVVAEEEVVAAVHDESGVIAEKELEPETVEAVVEEKAVAGVDTQDEAVVEEVKTVETHEPDAGIVEAPEPEVAVAESPEPQQDIKAEPVVKEEKVVPEQPAAEIPVTEKEEETGAGGPETGEEKESI